MSIPQTSCSICSGLKINTTKTEGMWLGSSSRHLTLIGKICIVETLAISKLIYDASVLTVPSNFSKEVNEYCFEFIWNFKPDKVKRNTIIGPLGKVGLNMIDFRMIDQVLKAAWVKRLHNARDSKWCSVFFGHVQVWRPVSPS